MIPFNKPAVTGNEEKYISQAIQSGSLCGDGSFTKKCQKWFEEKLGCHGALLTPSCTQALEMAAMLFDIQPGDEVIVPSYTFVTSANSFVLRGAKIVFVDIRPDTMNIDERKIEAAITPKTKAIVPVHYAGIACEMDTIMSIANKHNLLVVEDAAQGMMSTYKGRALGSIGHLGTYSFHETKNYTSGGEGGLLIVNEPSLMERAEIIREKGTNRKLFFRGMVDKYSWVDIGSSYLPSELQAAYLWAQLDQADEINADRISSWNSYNTRLSSLALSGHIELPGHPPECVGNAHMFYIKTNSLEERTALISHLKEKGITAVFHYIPLHSSVAGKQYSRFHGEDQYTTNESNRLLRLPLWYNMGKDVIDTVTKSITAFYNDRSLT